MITKLSRIAAAIAVVAVFVAAIMAALRPHPSPGPARLPAPVVLSLADDPAALHHSVLASLPAFARKMTVASKPHTARVPAPTPTYSGTPAPTYTAPAVAAPDPGTAQGIAYSLLPGYGFNQTTEYACLLQLWDRESGWRWNAEEPTTGAYGIPQSLPASKMAQFGADYLTDPATQIRWGLWYIQVTYGTPYNAWYHDYTAGWY